MRRIFRSLTITAVLTALSLSILLLPAYAGSTGRKNTAIVLTAATVHQYLTGKNKTALVGALASAQAWKSYEDARKRESRQKAYYSKYSRSRSHCRR